MPMRADSEVDGVRREVSAGITGYIPPTDRMGWGMSKHDTDRRNTPDIL